MCVEEFHKLLDEQGWDAAIEAVAEWCGEIDSPSISQYVREYYDAYNENDYKNTFDPDYGQCYMRRRRAIHNIAALLPHGPSKFVGKSFKND